MKKERVTAASTGMGFIFSHSISLFEKNMKCISVLNIAIPICT